MSSKFVGIRFEMRRKHGARVKCKMKHTRRLSRIGEVLVRVRRKHVNLFRTERRIHVEASHASTGVTNNNEWHTERIYLANEEEVDWPAAWGRLRKQFRCTVDLREVNKRLVTPTFPFPDLEEAGEYLAGAEYFACLDLVGGYTQCLLAPDSRKYFTISTRHGMFQSNRVPMGATASPPYLQSAMENVLAPILKHGALVYLDDIIVYGRTFEEFHKRLTKVLTLLEEADLKIYATKSVLIAREIVWCGRLWSQDGYEHLPSRTKALAQMPLPVDGAQLYQFLSAANWMRSSIPDYATLAAPLQVILEQVLAKVPGNKRKKKPCTKITLAPDVG